MSSKIRLELHRGNFTQKYGFRLGRSAHDAESTLLEPMSTRNGINKRVIDSILKNA